jgi:hypothetical protein
MELQVNHLSFFVLWLVFTVCASSWENSYAAWKRECFICIC